MLYRYTVLCKSAPYRKKVTFVCAMHRICTLNLTYKDNESTHIHVQTQTVSTAVCVCLCSCTQIIVILMLTYSTTCQNINNY